MKRRDILTALTFPLAGAGCAMPDDRSAAGPPAGAEIASAAYPPAGARWKLRWTDSGLFSGTVTEREIVAAMVDFEGRRGYALTGPPTVTVLDPVTFNMIGTVIDGRVASTVTPPDGPFLWPLWAGKAGSAVYSHHDRTVGRQWTGRNRVRVEGIEMVTVPAGTFRAFRIAYEGGIGTSSSGSGWRDEDRSTGLDTRETHWYAPAVKLPVKSIINRSSDHFRGAGRSLIELLVAPA